MKKSIATLLALICLGCQSPTPKQDPKPTASASVEHEAKGSHEHGEHSEEIHLTAEQMSSAGVQVEKLSMHSIAAELSATGVLSEDPDLKVHVTPRMTGKVIQLTRQVGESIAAGQLLAQLDSPDLARMKADYHEAETSARLAHQSLDRRRKQAQLTDELKQPLEQARQDWAAAESGLEVARAADEVALSKLQRGEALLKDGIISIAQVEQLRSEYRQAQSLTKKSKVTLEIARTHREREQRLASGGFLYNKELQETQAEAEKAEERSRHLRHSLEVVGADPDTDECVSVVTSPISGVISSRPVSRGQSVLAETELYTVLDTSRLWLLVDVFESDLPLLKLGLQVRVQVNAYPDQEFSGAVSSIAQELDPERHTAKARVVISNSGGKLKPGGFATVWLSKSNSRQVVAVPEEAVQTMPTGPTVFVQDEPGAFLPARVKVGARQNGLVEILEGLKPGQTVVTKGSFTLKSAASKGEMEGHEH